MSPRTSRFRDGHLSVKVLAAVAATAGGPTAAATAGCTENSDSGKQVTTTAVVTVDWMMEVEVDVCVTVETGTVGFGGVGGDGGDGGDGVGDGVGGTTMVMTGGATNDWAGVKPKRPGARAFSSGIFQASGRKRASVEPSMPLTRTATSPEKKSRSAG